MTPRSIDIGVTLAAAAMAVSVALALAGLTAQLTGAHAPAANAAPVRVAPPERAAPVAAAIPLALELRGVMLARPASASAALIAAPGGAVVAYAVGDMLPGGAVLDSVEYDLVVVRSDGRVATLAFPIASHTAPVLAAATPHDAAATPHDAAEPAQGQETLLASLGATATRDGYRLGTELSGEMRTAGLLPGDVVHRVDGQAVGDPARDRAILDGMVVAGRARVDALRDGRALTVEFPIH